MAASKKADNSNIVSIPASGTGAPRYDTDTEGNRVIRVNIPREDGGVDKYQLNNTDWSHPTMDEEMHLRVVRKRIADSGRVNLDNWTKYAEYVPGSDETSGLNERDIAF